MEIKRNKVKQTQNERDEVQDVFLSRFRSSFDKCAHVEVKQGRAEDIDWILNLEEVGEQRNEPIGRQGGAAYADGYHAYKRGQEAVGDPVATLDTEQRRGQEQSLRDSQKTQGKFQRPCSRPAPKCSSYHEATTLPSAVIDVSENV